MHSSLPLLALSLLGALVLPATSMAQFTAEPMRAEPDTVAKTAGFLASVIPTSPKKTGSETAAEKPKVSVLSGNVVDEWGNPLKGATVAIVGEKEKSVSTNAEGDYLLATTTAAPVLKVSYAGYVDTERIARGPADLLFKLDPINDYKRDLKKRSKAAAKAWK